MMRKQNKEDAMITPFTQAALAVLNDIACGEQPCGYTACTIAPHTLPELLACSKSI